MTKLTIRTIVLFFLIFLNSNKSYSQLEKAPAYPLINHDPYFSIWSFTDDLNASTTKHWTGADQSIIGILKVDGKAYRFMGDVEKSYRTILAASDEKNYTVKYTEIEPSEGWMKNDFTDVSWKTAAAPFGDNSEAKTQWLSKNIWVRRTFSLADDNVKNLYLKIQHDDNCEVYLNGDKIYDYTGWLNKIKYIPVENKLKAGANVLAIHVANTSGGAWLDAGLSAEEEVKMNADIKKAKQKEVVITATQTIYKFACGNVNLKLTFTSPLLMNDLMLLTRPVSYLSFAISADDRKTHSAQLYLGVSSGLAVNTPSQAVKATAYTSGNLSVLKAGSLAQPVLQKKGDDVRIDWGYVYVAAPQSEMPVQKVTPKEVGITNFVSTVKMPLQASQGTQLMLNTTLSFSNISKDEQEKYIMIGYDDIYAVQYFKQNLRPYWNKDRKSTIEKQLALANNTYKDVMKQCDNFNKTMYNDAKKAGGEDYAKLCVAAYRQSISAHKAVVSPQGDLLFLSKENFSNGSINTVDITYPSAPLYLLYNPGLLKGMMNGIFY